MGRPLPQWSECPPPAPGLYITFSADDKRRDEPGIAEWDGKVWQMHLGWYDHAITHWMPTDLNNSKEANPHG